MALGCTQSPIQWILGDDSLEFSGGKVAQISLPISSPPYTLTDMCLDIVVIPSMMEAVQQ